MSIFRCTPNHSNTSVCFRQTRTNSLVDFSPAKFKWKCRFHLHYMETTKPHQTRLAPLTSPPPPLRRRPRSLRRIIWDNQLIAHPHLLVRATNVWVFSARANFRVGLANESHWLQPMLVFTVHWWPAPLSVSGLLRPLHKWAKSCDLVMVRTLDSQGHFTHKTEGPWPLQSKSFHWSKGRRPSKFTSHTKVKAWRPKEDFMDEKSTWSPTWWTMDKVPWSPGIFVKPTFKRWAWQNFWETMICFKISL